jgi:uncharacterized protein
MSIPELWLLAVALAMDCFTVSIVFGVLLRKIEWRTILAVAFLFGLFQAMMPLAGWFATNSFSSLIEDYDHWIAFGLLAFLGGRMIKESFSDDEEEEEAEAKRGLSVLKYFCERVPEYHVAVAGSLLGIAMHQGESFPVGKVDILNIYPMTYCEFLLAKGKDQMVEILKKKDWNTIKLLKSQYIKYLREYYFVGGMPEAVNCFITTNDAVRVRKVQNDILFTYQKDISKHVPTVESNRINMVWQSMPSQLVKENKKFIYGVAKPGGRAKDFEVAIQWLMDAGLVYKAERITEPKTPLKFSVDISSFKLFLLDCGLLGAMSETPAENLLVTDNGMEESKGAFTENFVMSQLVATRDTSVFYYSNNSKLEIDFLIQQKSQVVPIEVKAEAL